ncbi:uncharacterized protein F4812DRAFT_459025 [Daldinia caldariorum]|uniref:uncharacterized protein n=1 Tax=Daldinia caldariorum TaxID=326644 RepID=UPI0020087738|nr:uncharacterized protein F4812DRAFT_459025 [Daldinia caldariorum]KAI1468595.1 hypothetical protein F4812DRAFT_459025 [Daldinia caldariorum]
MTSTIGIPIKLLNEAQGHIVTLEITSGQTYRGKLLEAEDNMNVQLKDITVTARDGRECSHVPKSQRERSWCRSSQRTSDGQQSESEWTRRPMSGCRVASKLVVCFDIDRRHFL